MIRQERARAAEWTQSSSTRLELTYLSSGGDLRSWKFFTDGAVALPLKSTRQDDRGSYRLSLW